VPSIGTQHGLCNHLIQVCIAVANQHPIEHSKALEANCLFMNRGNSGDNPMTILRR
jgi:hypothetical protein